MRNLDHYLIRSRSLFDRTPDYQRRFRSSDCDEFQRYIDTEAIIYYREMTEVGVPLPNWKDMLTVCGETDIRAFLAVGYGCFEAIFKHITVHHEYPQNILDFGVGCARTTRFFFRYQDVFACYGCDVDSSCITYCKQIDFLNTQLSPNKPPSPYKEAFFDIIFSISVFTHLTYDSFFEWIRELTRIAKKGAILIISVHGNLAFDRINRDSSSRRLINIEEGEFNSKKMQFHESGFLWLKQSTTSKDIDTSQYGISFVDQGSLTRLLPSNLMIEKYEAGAIGDWQDLFIARKIS